MAEQYDAVRLLEYGFLTYLIVKWGLPPRVFALSFEFIPDLRMTTERSSGSGQIPQMVGILPKLISFIVHAIITSWRGI